MKTENQKVLKVKVTFLDEALGMTPSDPNIVREYIASKAPDAKTLEDEVAAVGIDETVQKGKTVFPRHEGKPVWYNYQIKGAFKDACRMLWRVKGTRSNKLKASIKVIDGAIFVQPRHIPINIPDGAALGDCQRPLRVSDAAGERVCLANSETVPPGSWFEFEVVLLDAAHESVVREWLEYWQLRGLGQWRNSGKGIATCEVSVSE